MRKWQKLKPPLQNKFLNNALPLLVLACLGADKWQQNPKLALAARGFILLIVARRLGKAMERIAKLLMGASLCEAKANNYGAERPFFF
jgi:hypothetical protein